jgi:DNA-binding transcriptional MerR regulator
VSYSIAEVAERSGLSIDTLRYYEKIGLIEPPPRDSGGRRSYSEDDLGWVAFLLRLRSTGMPIRLMKEYADLRRIGPVTAARRKDILVQHREEIGLRMAEMQAFLEVLDTKIENYAAIAATEEGMRQV